MTETVYGQRFSGQHQKFLVFQICMKGLRLNRRGCELVIFWSLSFQGLVFQILGVWLGFVKLGG